MQVLQQQHCCRIAGLRHWPNCSKGFKSIQVTFLLYQITRQDCLWFCNGIWLTNALSSEISGGWELEFGIMLKETGRKTGLSGYCMTLGFWKNGFYSSYTSKSPLQDVTELTRVRFVMKEGMVAKHSD